MEFFSDEYQPAMLTSYNQSIEPNSGAVATGEPLQQSNTDKD
jgi:hypothetical protein